MSRLSRTRLTTPSMHTKIWRAENVHSGSYSCTGRYSSSQTMATYYGDCSWSELLSTKWPVLSLCFARMERWVLGDCRRVFGIVGPFLQPSQLRTGSDSPVS